MRLKSALLKLKNVTVALCKNPNIYTTNKDYIFIVSHMRSRSTLLAHILGSHQEIDGHSECQLSYRNKIDLIQLRTQAYTHNDQQLNGKHILDKILHDGLPLRECILKHKQLKLIYLIRRPDDAIPSILSLGHTTQVERYKNQEWCINYYMNRLESIKNYAKTTGRNGLFINSDDIINNTKETLQDIATHLELKSPLSDKYSIFKHTGKAKHGDPSKNITKGEIIHQKTEHEFSDIDKEMMKKAQASYDSCQISLKESCNNILQ